MAMYSQYQKNSGMMTTMHNHLVTMNKSAPVLSSILSGMSVIDQAISEIISLQFPKLEDSIKHISNEFSGLEIRLPHILQVGHGGSMELTDL